MPYTDEEIVKAYEILVKGIESTANESEERAYGGIIRAGKGKLVESIARHMVEIAWYEIGGSPQRLSFEKKSYKIPIVRSYIERIKHKEVRDYIYSHIDDYYYSIKTDIHVSIDNKMIMGIECKAYTENAMLKRILVDFTLLKSVIPNIHCVLIQLESQLTGDYSEPLKKISYGSPSTHTLMSYFDVDLVIITLLEGERRVDAPIHILDHYKELKIDVLKSGISILSSILSNYL